VELEGVLDVVPDRVPDVNHKDFSIDLKAF
jgi:hypothetical protein